MQEVTNLWMNVYENSLSEGELDVTDKAGRSNCCSQKTHTGMCLSTDRFGVTTTLENSNTITDGNIVTSPSRVNGMR